ncbi:hypothetical protein AB0M96_37380, partial [Streptomyces sp. NPDC051098]
VITEPEHVGNWFGQGSPTPVDLRPGGTMHLDAELLGARFQEVAAGHLLMLDRPDAVAAAVLGTDQEASAWHG